MTFAEFLRTPLAEWEDECTRLNVKLADKIRFRSLHNENSKCHTSVVPAASAPQARLTQEAQELQGLDGCIQHVTALQARLATGDGDRNFVLKNFSLWKELFAKLQSVPNLTGLADKKAEVLPHVQVLHIWERELRARAMQKRSELQQRGLMLTVPDLVVVGIEREAAQRICSFE